MNKRPITLKIPETWVKQEDAEKFYVVIHGERFGPRYQTFHQAKPLFDQVNHFFDCIQKIQEFIDDQDGESYPRKAA